jgi:Tfp pilus assembly protein PilO
MSVATMNGPAHGRPRVLQTVLRPLDEWSRRRMSLSAAALGAAVLVAGTQTWRASGLDQLDASRGALNAIQTQADAAGRMVAELPALRARVAANALSPERWTAADALHDVAQLAAQSGLRVSAIEPVPVLVAAAAVRTAAQPPNERALKFRAEGAFPDIVRFLDASSGLPRLVVPERTQIRRQNGVLGIETTLRVFDALPAVPLSMPPRTDAFVVDPFGKDAADGFGNGAALLLVGTFVRRDRAMALVQAGPGVGGFVPGERVGDERIGRIAPREVLLAGDDGASRMLTIADSRDAGSFGRVPGIDVASGDVASSDASVMRRKGARGAPAVERGSPTTVGKKRQAPARAEDEQPAFGKPRYSIFDKGRTTNKANSTEGRK